MGVNRKRPCSESDAYPDSKKRQLFSHPADATSTSLPSLVSKRVFNTLKESPTDTTSPDARLRTRQTAEVWLRGQQHSDSAQISDTIKSSVEEAHVVNPAVEGITEGPRISKTSTLREDTCFAPPQTSWKSREGTKSASLSTHNLHQKPRGSLRSLHLEESRSRERSILPPSRAPATLGSFTGKTALKQPSHSSSATFQQSSRDVAQRSSVRGPSNIQENERSLKHSLTKANLREHTCSWSTRFAEGPESFVEEALEEWAFVMSKNTGNSKNVTTGDRDYHEKINLRNIHRADQVNPTPAPPTNYEFLSTMLKGGSESKQSSEAQRKLFAQRLSKTVNERAVTRAYKMVVDYEVFESSINPYFEYVEDKAWTNFRVLGSELQPQLAPPKPDHAIGIQKDKFPKTAYAYMGEYASPACKEGPWILFLQEDKEDKTTKAISQNMWSGAHCVNNILALKRTLGTQKSFYDVAKVFSMVADKSCLRVWVHWVHLENEEDIFYSQELKCWKMLVPKLSTIHAARRASNNIFHYLQHTIGAEIEKDMKTLATNLKNPRWKAPWFPPPLLIEKSKDGESQEPSSATSS